MPPTRSPTAGRRSARPSLIAAAEPAAKIASTRLPRPSATDNRSTTPPAGRRRTPQRDMLIGLTESCEFWHDANRTAYATFTVNGHSEHWPVRSRDFRMWLSGRFYEETGGAIGGQALKTALRILEARAVNDGPEYEPFIRVGRHGGKLYPRSVRRALARGGDHRRRLDGGRQAAGEVLALILHARAAGAGSRRHDRGVARVS